MGLFRHLGNGFLDIISLVGGLYLVFFNIAKSLFKRPFPYRELIDQAVKVGYSSIGVVAVTAFFTGLVFAFQIGMVLNQIISGSTSLIGAMVGLAFVKELGPVLTAIIVCGKTGSAMAAEIGTMKVTEQIDALQTLATDPFHYIGLPRMLASALTMPLLTLWAIVIGCIGGGFVSAFAFNQSIQTYISQLESFIPWSYIEEGMIKAAVFGIIISMASCTQGFRTTGGAEGVGRATTSAVVMGSIGILIADYILAIIITKLTFSY